MTRPSPFAPSKAKMRTFPSFSKTLMFSRPAGEGSGERVGHTERCGPKPRRFRHSRHGRGRSPGCTLRVDRDEPGCAQVLEGLLALATRSPGRRSAAEVQSLLVSDQRGVVWRNRERRRNGIVEAEVDHNRTAVFIFCRDDRLEVIRGTVLGNTNHVRDPFDAEFWQCEEYSPRSLGVEPRLRTKELDITESAIGFLDAKSDFQPSIAASLWFCRIRLGHFICTRNIAEFVGHRHRTGEFQLLNRHESHGRCDEEFPRGNTCSAPRKIGADPNRLVSLPV